MTSTSSARRQRTPRRPPPPRELREAGLSARKALGQHFLTSTRYLRRIADAATEDGWPVIEIGAGLGALTAALAERAPAVVAVEIDDALAAYLRRRFAGTNVHVVHADALAVEPAAALDDAGATPPYVLAGNLPYYVAQPILRRFLEATPKPERLVVMVQDEVAESMCARPGAMSLLSVSVQLYGEPRILFRVPPSAFYPPPKVRSAIVRIDVAPALRADVDDTDAFFRVARAGFSTKRKQLRNALANGLDVPSRDASALLQDAGIDPTRRAQTLTIEDWAGLARAWAERGRPEGTR